MGQTGMYRRDFMKEVLKYGGIAAGGLSIGKIFEKDINAIFNAFMNSDGAKSDGSEYTPLNNTGKNTSGAGTAPLKNNIYVLMGVTDDDMDLPQMLDTAKYLNESQKVPKENIKTLKSSEFTYENFERSLIELNVPDNAVVLIDISSEGSGDGFAFSEEGIPFNKANANYQHTYTEIAESINKYVNPNAKKIIMTNACYDGYAIRAFKDVGIPHSGIYTSTSEKDKTGVTFTLSAVHDGLSPRKDINGDKRISFKEVFLGVIHGREDMDGKDLAVPQFYDPENIGDEVFLND